MFARIRSFFYTNRRKLFFGTTITAATLFFIIRYLHSLFINHQKRLSEERFNREQIRRRFEQTQKDALFTIWALVPVLDGSISQEFDVEKITTALRARRNNKPLEDVSVSGVSSGTHQEELVNEWSKKSKNELWEELKSQSLTKILVMLYGNALLIIFTRLQLNILARREYLEDAMRIASTKHGFGSKIEMIDKESTSYITEQAYLSFSWWLLNRGWLALKERVKSAVDEVFEEINPRVELTLNEFSILLEKTQRLIERVDENGDSFIGRALLPPRNLENFVMQQILDDSTIETLQCDSSDLRLLLDETNQYINSSSSLIVLSSLINSGLTLFMYNIAMANCSNTKDGEIPPNQIKLKLAVLLASCAKASNNFKSGENNEYVNQMDGVPELDELSASVYSNFE